MSKAPAIDDDGRAWTVGDVLWELDDARSIAAASDIPRDLYKRLAVTLRIAKVFLLRYESLEDAGNG